jgi:hypothetical protein
VAQSSTPPCSVLDPLSFARFCVGLLCSMEVLWLFRTFFCRRPAALFWCVLVQNLSCRHLVVVLFVLSWFCVVVVWCCFAPALGSCCRLVWWSATYEWWSVGWFGALWLWWRLSYSAVWVEAEVLFRWSSSSVFHLVLFYVLGGEGVSDVAHCWGGSAADLHFGVLLAFWW